MKCPRCNTVLVCGCKHCLVNFPAKDNEKVVISNGDDTDTCPTCGLTMHLDKWFDVATEEYKQLNGESEGN